MPPRKRTQSAPKTEEPTAEPLAEDEGAQQDSSPTEPEPADDTRPKRSERKAADLPCNECFPNGWPETSTAVGCEHGTWTRD